MLVKILMSSREELRQIIDKLIAIENNETFRKDCFTTGLIEMEGNKVSIWTDGINEIRQSKRKNKSKVA